MRIAKLYAASTPKVVLFSEFTSADGFLRSAHVRRRLDFSPEEHPYFVQLFGSNPASFLSASLQLEQAGVAGVDINMGCPAKKNCTLTAWQQPDARC